VLVVGILFTIAKGVRSCARIVWESLAPEKPVQRVGILPSGQEQESRSAGTENGSAGSDKVAAKLVGRPEVSLVMLAARPELWPREVRLCQRLPVTNEYGVVELPVGIVLNLVRVDTNGLVVAWNNQTNRIPYEATDLVTRSNLQRQNAGK
jgi:hypothetical protein